jgi:hypothetical protein
VGCQPLQQIREAPQKSSSMRSPVSISIHLMAKRQATRLPTSSRNATKIQCTGTECPLLDCNASTNGNACISGNHPTTIVCDMCVVFDCSYTWQIYATKVLNMGSMYGFWRTLDKQEKQDKQHYLNMFYNLHYRKLVSQGPLIAGVGFSLCFQGAKF